MAPVCWATGVWGSAAGCKKEGVYSERSQPNSAAGEKTPLVSVMSGQSHGVLGPGIGHAAPGERPPRPSKPALMTKRHHETFKTKSLLFATQPHYLNNTAIWICMHPHALSSNIQDVNLFLHFALHPYIWPRNPLSNNILNILIVIYRYMCHPLHDPIQFPELLWVYKHQQVLCDDLSITLNEKSCVETLSLARCCDTGSAAE